MQSFPTTLWTVILRADRDATALRGAALEQLCHRYWYPLYSFVRRRGYNPDDAQDLTQAFFARLLEKNGLAGVDPAKGRFRTFLLASMKHFLANDWDRSKSLKRGGGQAILSLDNEAESRFQREPSHDWTPERYFERQWAMTLLDGVLEALGEEYRSEGNGDLFEELKSVLAGDGAKYADIAMRLGRSEGAIKVAVHRLKRRYRELMRTRIADTVGEDEVDDELRQLLGAIV